MWKIFFSVVRKKLNSDYLHKSVVIIKSFGASFFVEHSNYQSMLNKKRSCRFHIYFFTSPESLRGICDSAEVLTIFP